MGTAIRLVAVVAGAIAIDVGVEALGLRIPLSPDRAEIAASLGAWAMEVCVFLIPAIFVFYPPTSGTERRWTLRVVVAVLFTWHTLVVLRMGVTRPALRSLAIENGNYKYDGVGMNAVVLVMGWVMPLAVTLVMVLGLRAVSAWRRRNATRHTPDHDVAT